MTNPNDPVAADLVEAHRARTAMEAQVVKAVLVAAGIEGVWIRGENPDGTGAREASQLAGTTGVEVFVPRRFLDAARRAIEDARAAGRESSAGAPPTGGPP